VIKVRTRGIEPLTPALQRWNRVPARDFCAGDGGSAVSVVDRGDPGGVARLWHELLAGNAHRTFICQCHPGDAAARRGYEHLCVNAVPVKQPASSYTVAYALSGYFVSARRRP
jgi:hypothetical protein